MENFTPVSALIGGVLIGTAVTLLLWLNGRVAGISSIAGGLLPPVRGDAGWRIAFLCGLAIGAALWRATGGAPQAIEVTGSLPVLLAGGLLVGFGTRVGGGCTSGHGVCGLARLSPRSLVATLIFMATAGLTVYAVRHLAGG